MAEATGSTRPGGRGSRGWLAAAALLAVTAAAYTLFPELIPDRVSEIEGTLLLGMLTGLAVGVGVRSGPRLMPFVAAGAAIGVGTRALHLDFPAAAAVLLGLVVAGEIAGLAWALRRCGAERLTEPASVGWLLVLATGAGLATSVLAALVLHYVAGTSDPILAVIRTTAVDDVFGLMVITPAVLLVGRPFHPTIGKTAELAGAVSLTVVTNIYLFTGITPGEPGLLGWPYIVVLGPLWIAIRLGAYPVSVLSAVMYLYAVTATAAGLGPFTVAAANPLDQLVAVELFAITMAGAVLLLGVLRDARVRAAVELAAANRFFREVVNGSDAAIFAKSYEGPDAEHGRYVLANEASHRITGLPEARLLGRSDSDVLAPDVAELLVARDLSVMESGHPRLTEERLPWTDGTMHTYSSATFPLIGADKRVWGVAGIATDITELIKSREVTAHQAELLHAVFELSPTPALRLTLDEGIGIRVIAANAAMCTLMAAPTRDVENCDLLEQIHPDDVATALEVLRFATASAAEPSLPPRQRELRMQTMDGRGIWALMSAASVRDGDADDAEIVVQFEDFTARRQAEEALTHQAMRDAVTGLPNRRALQERMDAALQRLRRRRGTVTVLFCDLDHFKDINDSLGHQVGDQLLVEVAGRLRSAVRPEDTLARLGGDEFVAFGEGLAESADAVLLAIRLQDKLGAPWVLDEQVFRPAMSIGIAMTSDPDVTVDEMLRRADLAMYRAKETGRNRIEVYDRTVDEEVQHAVSIQRDLRRAIDTDQLVLLYQPIVRLADGVQCGAEALVRMRDESGRLIAPAEFVPQAEATGLVVPMGAWVVQRALADLKVMHRDVHDSIMSINVSPSQIREEGFAAFLLDSIERAGVRPECVGIEVTETALIQDPTRSARELGILSAAGIQIALDDFGTGYSSLSWLTQFPVNSVKIDKSFTDDVGIDDRKTAIISAVIAVSHELGFVTVAEGVETTRQAEALLLLGCDRGQGYLYGRPGAITEPPWATGR